MKHFLTGVAISFLKPIFAPTGTYQLMRGGLYSGKTTENRM